MGLLSKQVVTLVVASTIATSSAFAPSLVSPLARRGALSLRSASRYSSLAGGVRMSSQASDKLTGQKFEENVRNFLVCMFRFLFSCLQYHTFLAGFSIKKGASWTR